MHCVRTHRTISRFEPILYEYYKDIYIADDDEDDRMLLREAIHSVIEDVVIKEVSHGEELIDQLKLESLPGEIIILLDMNMPKMNGLKHWKYLNQLLIFYISRLL